MIPTSSERMAVLIARLLGDGDLAATGAASEIPLAACLLARQLHAPSLTVVAAGVFVNPRHLPSTFAAGELVPCEYVGDFSDVFTLTETGVDVMFYSGLQIDQYGNVNLHRLTENRRGPGLANTSFGVTAKRLILWCSSHEPRRMVDKVSFTSVIGHTRDSGSNYIGGRATHLVTDLAVFESVGGRFEASGMVDGITWDTVRNSTGWGLSETPPPTLAEPTTQEISILRGLVDPKGVLRRSQC